MDYQYQHMPVTQEFVPHNNMYFTDHRVRPGFGIGRRPGFGFGRPGFGFGGPGFGLGLGFLGGLATGALLTPGPGFGYPYYPYPPYPYPPYYYY
ncbi:hypothetical protein PBF_10832 [Cytobacillus firmus DS1]|uniref:Spore coat protein n=2 Tax=Cytobacillus firmus TaxID=1399 RepID=W7L6D5_CYTFI|nr:hypothetical protein PBF_10832 [Cytobacillus firmus DS1]